VLTLFKPLIIEGEEVTLTPVTEDKIKEVVLVHAYAFYHPFDDSLIKYDLSKVLLIPIYDYKGNLYVYNTYVYLGEGESPTLEEVLFEIEEPVRYLYSYLREYNKPPEIIEEYREILRNTSDNLFHQIYFIPYFEKKPLSPGGGEGFFFDINLYWLAVIGIEEEFPGEDIEFIRFITIDGSKYGYEFEVNRKEYLVEPELFTYEVNITPIEEVRDSLYTIDDLKYSLDENAKEWAQESWDRMNECITKLKSGVDFIDENSNKEAPELNLQE
jgi:hypothetical protein